MKKVLLFLLFSYTCVAMAPNEAHADALMVTRAMTASTIAEIYISSDTVRVELEIGARDVYACRNVMPDGLYEKLAGDGVPLETRLVEFFESDWVIKADGEALAGDVSRLIPRLRVNRDEVTGEPLPLDDNEGEPVVFAELTYPLRSRPRTMSIRPPTGDKGGVAATIGFVAYHRNLPVTDFRYLGMEETVDLDWDDPWFSRFRNRNLKRQFDAPMSAFIYVEPFEVRKEIIVRPRDLQRWVDLGLEGKDVIPVEEQAEVKRRVAEFLTAQGPVTIDGRTPKPELDRIHFVSRTLRRTGIVDPPEDLSVISATLGVIFVYPITGLPNEVSMPWGLFDERIQRVPAVATDEAGGLPYFLMPGDSILIWKNFLKNPTTPAMVDIASPSGVGRVPVSLLSLACAALLTLTVVGYIRMRPRRRWMIGVSGALIAGTVLGLPFTRVVIPIPGASVGGVSDAEAEEIVSGLLTNVYRAFDYRDEGTIYDTLSMSASGDLLTQVYLETRRALELQSQGGARVKVKEVAIQSIESAKLSGEAGFNARCTWNVAGSVGHWGHLHTRVNRYDAEFTIKPVDGVWKITGLELIEEQRVSFNQVNGGYGRAYDIDS
jgi:hypothetical protein